MGLRRESGKNTKVNKKAIRLKFEIKAFIIKKYIQKGKKEKCFRRMKTKNCSLSQ
jgi:hypothetical protein